MRAEERKELAELVRLYHFYSHIELNPMLAESLLPRIRELNYLARLEWPNQKI